MKLKAIFQLFIIFCLYFLSSCDFISQNRNVIAAKFSEIDTGLKYIIIEKDTVTHILPKVDSSLIAVKTDTISKPVIKDTIKTPAPAKPVVQPIVQPTKVNLKTQELVNFAKTMAGKPYKSGAKDPAIGFDNVGFISYVFNNFKVEVPKYTAGFIVAGDAVDIKDAAEGDIILFSKTDSVKKVVNHVGIVVSAKGSPISFIHATSGKVNGVTVTALNSYYQKKVMGIRRVF